MRNQEGIRKLLWDYIEENITKSSRPIDYKTKISVSQISEPNFEMYYKVIIDNDSTYFVDLSDILVWLHSKTIKQ